MPSAAASRDARVPASSGYASISCAISTSAVRISDDAAIARASPSGSGAKWRFHEAIRSVQPAVTVAGGGGPISASAGGSRPALVGGHAAGKHDGESPHGRTPIARPTVGSMPPRPTSAARLPRNTSRFQSRW